MCTWGTKTSNLWYYRGFLSPPKISGYPLNIYPTAMFFILNISFEGDYFGSTSTKIWVWLSLLPIALKSKQYLSSISKHTFFKILMISVSKKSFLDISHKKSHFISSFMGTISLMPQFHLHYKGNYKCKSVSQQRFSRKFPSRSKLRDIRLK